MSYSVGQQISVNFEGLSLSPFCAVFGIILAAVSSETVSKIVWQGSE